MVFFDEYLTEPFFRLMLSNLVRQARNSEYSLSLLVALLKLAHERFVHLDDHTIGELKLTEAKIFA